jgi:hypothetical protein
LLPGGSTRSLLSGDNAIDPGLERHHHNLDHRRVLTNLEHAAARAAAAIALHSRSASC